MMEKGITGIILAGGKSSRMGKDKGFVELNNKSFISHIINALQPVVDTIIIVSNNSEYDVFKLKRVEDIIKDSGPLAGLYSGLFYSESVTNLVLSCDVPLINTLVLNELIKELDTETDAVQVESQGRSMPLVGIYKKHCLDSFLKQLELGERRVQVAVEQLKLKTIKLKPEMEQYVRNINTKNELKDLKHEFEY